MKKKQLTRRKFLPFLGLGMLLPWVGVAAGRKSEEAEYETLLTADGKLVKVKKDHLSRAEVVNKHMSNKNLLSWLGKKK